MGGGSSTIEGFDWRVREIDQTMPVGMDRNNCRPMVLLILNLFQDGGISYRIVSYRIVSMEWNGAAA